MLAPDISNYTGTLIGGWPAALREHDNGLVIVQAVDPPPPYPPTHTWDQLNTLAAHAIPTDVYVWLYFIDDWHVDLKRRLALLDGHTIRRIWIDVEENDSALSGAAAGWTPADRAGVIREALGICDNAGEQFGFSLLDTSGIYSAAWYWNNYLAGIDEFADRPLWVVDWDGVAGENIWNQFGGWESYAIKQYQGTTTYLGQPNCDLNWVHPSEAERVLVYQAFLNGEIAVVPAEDPCARYLTAIADVTKGDVYQTLRDELERRNSYGRRLGLRKSIIERAVRRLEAVAAEFSPN